MLTQAPPQHCSSLPQVIPQPPQLFLSDPVLDGTGLPSQQEKPLGTWLLH